jgi:ABC-type sugar transport system permease subunit
VASGADSGNVAPTRAPARTASLAIHAGRALGEAVFVLPVVIVVAVLIVLPTGSAVVHAFTNWQPGYPSAWVGFDNFSSLLRSSSFQQILRNQAILLIGLPFWTLLPLLVAALLYQGVRAPGIFRTIFFFPATVSPAVIGILFSFILGPTGPLNSTLRDVGLGGLASNWLSDPSLVKPVIIAVLAWATMGTGVVIFSAALSGVPPELFEAASLDGASWLQRFWYVTVPSVRRVIELWVVILVITVFVAVFPWIFTLTRGGPGFSSTTIDFDIYQNALQFGYYGIAAAEAVVLLVIVAVVVGLGSVVSRLRGNG